MSSLRARIVNLDKQNIDVIAELLKRGIRVNPGDFSCYIKKRIQGTPTSDLIVSETEKIITEWEKAKKEK